MGLKTKKKEVLKIFTYISCLDKKKCRNLEFIDEGLSDFETGLNALQFGKLTTRRTNLSGDRGNIPGAKKKSKKKIPVIENAVGTGLSLPNYFSMLGKIMHFVKNVKQKLAYKNIGNLNDNQFKIINDNAHGIVNFNSSKF